MVVANAVLNPEIDVVADVTQGSLDLEIFVCVGVGCPKAFLSSDFIGGFGIDQHIRHVEFSAQPGSQVDRVIDRHCAFVELPQSIGSLFKLGRVQYLDSGVHKRGEGSGVHKRGGGFIVEDDGSLPKGG